MILSFRNSKLLRLSQIIHLYLEKHFYRYHDNYILKHNKSSFAIIHLYHRVIRIQSIFFYNFEYQRFFYKCTNTQKMFYTIVTICLSNSCDEWKYDLNFDCFNDYRTVEYAKKKKIIKIWNPKIYVTTKRRHYKNISKWDVR